MREKTIIRIFFRYMYMSQILIKEKYFTIILEVIYLIEIIIFIYSWNVCILIWIL